MIQQSYFGAYIHSLKKKRPNVNALRQNPGKMYPSSSWDQAHEALPSSKQLATWPCVHVRSPFFSVRCAHPPPRLETPQQELLCLLELPGQPASLSFMNVHLFLNVKGSEIQVSRDWQSQGWRVKTGRSEDLVSWTLRTSLWRPTGGLMTVALLCLGRRHILIE